MSNDWVYDKRDVSPARTREAVRSALRYKLSTGLRILNPVVCHHLLLSEQSGICVTRQVFEEYSVLVTRRSRQFQPYTRRKHTSDQLPSR